MSADIKSLRGEERKPRLLTEDDLRKLPPPRWLIEKMIGSQTLSLLVGPSNAGKSFLALDFAMSIITGIDSIGKVREQGSVVYICAEGQNSFIRRIDAWRKHHSCKEGTLLVIPEAINFMNQATVFEVEHDIRGAGIAPKLIVIDTVAACMFEGSENDNNDMSRFARNASSLMKAFSCSVLLVHHTGKDGTTRGATSFPAAVDNHLLIRKLGEGMEIIDKKQRDDAKEPIGYVRMDIIPLGKEMTSCVLVKDEEAVEEQRQELKVTRERMEGKDQRKLLVKILKGVELSSTDLKEAFMKKTDCSKATFYRLLRECREEELIEEVDDKYRIPEDR